MDRQDAGQAQCQVNSGVEETEEGLLLERRAIQVQPEPTLRSVRRRESVGYHNTTALLDLGRLPSPGEFHKTDQSATEEPYGSRDRYW